jgi:hypothetical protein
VKKGLSVLRRGGKDALPLLVSDARGLVDLNLCGCIGGLPDARRPVLLLELLGDLIDDPGVAGSVFF